MSALRKLLLLLPLVAAGACAAKPGLDDAKAVFAQSGLASLADAACHGDVHAIDQLLQDGAPVDGEGKRSTTPLAWAVGCRDVEGVRRLLEAGADPNHLIDGKYTVFWAAVAHDNVNILRAMVAHGADIDFMAPDEATPLMHAVTVGAWHSYDYLIEAGADLNKAGPVTGGTVALECIAAFRFDRIIELIDKGYRYDLVVIAVEVNDLPLIEQARPERDRLLAVLKAHGVEWPLPKLLTDEARAAYMSAHPAYARAHPESAPRSKDKH